MKEYYVVLHGAKKNVGDFLIKDRSMKLLKYLREDRELVDLPSWESLDNNLELVNKSKGLIVMGGPGATSCFYPKGYLLLSDMEKLQVPFILLGSGSYEKVYNNTFKKNFTFCEKTKRLLKMKTYLSTRDDFSNALFTENGYDSKMTGCPTFYNIECLGRKLQVSKNNKIVFTPPANMVFKRQSILIMKKLRDLFPEHKIYCSFNRGYKADKYTTEEYAKNIEEIVQEAEKLNYIVSDTSYDLNKIDYYNECDFHVGYRLHSHIHFISRRAPSFLVTEDSRSFGHSHTMNLKMFEGAQYNMLSAIYSLGNRYINYFINKYYSPVKANNMEMIDKLIEYIDNEYKSDFKSFINIPNRIDELFENNMKPYIKSLP